MDERPLCFFDETIPRDTQGCLPVAAMSAAVDCRIEPGLCFALYSTEPKEESMSTEPTPEPNPETTPANAPKPPTIEVPVAPMPRTETIEMPSSGDTANITALLPKDGSGATGSTVLLAVVAVAGSGAAMKLWQSISKQRHEQKMKELESKDENHAKCAAERMALDAKVTSIESRVSAVEQAKSSPELPDLPDFDELESRLKKVEKSVATKAKK